ncbi:nitrous oxide reductase family maturation protein NosD [Gemmatimonas aurantiaca]|nr:nitrous oxide reductase family maturation protein NosD [Gemmatimonas aurantiaca]
MTITLSNIRLHYFVALFLYCAAASSVQPAVIRIAAESEYVTVAQGIAASSPYDTVLVSGGVYHEDSIRVNHPLTLIGEVGAILDGAGGGEIMRIQSDSVTIVGLTFRNTEISFMNDNAALYLDNVSHCLVADCIFENNFFGIYLAQSSYCEIRNNQLTGFGTRESTSANGIHLWYCKNILVIGNTISGHRDGIYFEFVEDGEIRDNHSSGNHRYGLHFMFSHRCLYENNKFVDNGAGVAVMYTEEVTMINNLFARNWGGAAYGLLLKDITDSRIENNVFFKNSVGIYAEGVSRVTVRHCTFNDNGWAVKIMANSLDNLFTENNFISNTFDVATNSSQHYSLFDKNYWSEFRGYDLDRDGAGDVPYHPVRLFSLLVEKQPPALMLLRSTFVDLLDLAEKAIPSLTPKTLIDSHPQMAPYELERE